MSDGFIRFVTRTDVHISDHTPQSRIDDWATTVEDKLTQVGEIAREVEADAVLDNGDIFDVKSPGRNSHALVRRVASVHSKYPCPTFGNVGNHDCVYGNIEFLDQQPLGVLFASGVFQRCYDDYQLITKTGELEVRVVGVPYHGTEYDLERFKIDKCDEDWLVCMAHVLASPAGGSMFENEDIIKYADLLTISPDVDVWVMGHWHKDQGIVEIAPGKWVVNVGALTRGALSQDDVNREPAVAILNFTKEGIDIERRNLRVQPASEVFDLERRVQAESRSMTMDALVNSITETLAEGKEGESLRDKIMRADVPQEVREEAILRIESAQNDR